MDDEKGHNDKADWEGLREIDRTISEDRLAPWGRALRCIPRGRKAWLFCGFDRGGQRAAIIYTLIQTAKLNDVDPQAWLADVLARIADHPATGLDELLPWNWAQHSDAIAA